MGRRRPPEREIGEAGVYGPTAWQLACADTGDIRRKFSVILSKTVLELRGEPVIEHEDPDALSQSISHSRTFGKPVTEFEEMVESVCTYTAKAAEKLRKERQRAAGVNVYFQYFPEYEPRRLDGGWTTTTINFEPPDQQHRPDAVSNHTEAPWHLHPGATV